MIDAYEKQANAKETRRLAIKYYLPLIIALFAVLTAGGIAAQLFTLQQLNKTSGKIISAETKIISWSHNRGTSGRTPDYALVIKLNNDSTYKVQETVYRIKLAGILHANDQVTIYYPTPLTKILSVGLIRDVNQIERNGEVLYSWQEQKEGDRVFLFIFAGFAAALYGFRRYLISANR